MLPRTELLGTSYSQRTAHHILGAGLAHADPRSHLPFYATFAQLYSEAPHLGSRIPRVNSGQTGGVKPISDLKGPRAFPSLYTS